MSVSGYLGKNKKSTQHTHSNPKTHLHHSLAPSSTSIILIRLNDHDTAGTIANLWGRGSRRSVASGANKEALVVVGFGQEFEVDWAECWRWEALLIDRCDELTFNSSDRERGRRW